MFSDLLLVCLAALIASALQAYWVVSLLAPHPLTGAKLSILCLYHRLFSIDRTFRVTIYVTGLLCIAWWIAATISLICTCIPISSAWKPALPGFPPRPGDCFDYRWFTIGIEIPNCILDFWIVLMPIFEIRKLQLSLKIKTSILFMFLLAELYVICVDRWPLGLDTPADETVSLMQLSHRVGIFSFVRMIRIGRNPTRKLQQIL